MTVYLQTPVLLLKLHSPMAQVPGIPKPEDGHPAVLGPDGKWHYHTAAWWAKQA